MERSYLLEWKRQLEADARVAVWEEAASRSLDLTRRPGGWYDLALYPLKKEPQPPELR